MALKYGPTFTAKGIEIDLLHRGDQVQIAGFDVLGRHFQRRRRRSRCSTPGRRPRRPASSSRSESNRRVLVPLRLAMIGIFDRLLRLGDGFEIALPARRDSRPARGSRSATRRSFPCRTHGRGPSRSASWSICSSKSEGRTAAAAPASSSRRSGSSCCGQRTGGDDQGVFQFQAEIRGGQINAHAFTSFVCGLFSPLPSPVGASASRARSTPAN